MNVETCSRLNLKSYLPGMFVSIFLPSSINISTILKLAPNRTTMANRTSVSSDDYVDPVIENAVIGIKIDLDTLKQLTSSGAAAQDARHREVKESIEKAIQTAKDEGRFEQDKDANEQDANDQGVNDQGSSKAGEK
ncbi:hypothetical protein AYO20_06515 [Fonsecaea nubica]|uniref:Uncharacterized protein n=1 Tax=Fonsecaea nubica TaxID=856822 RepID=A0A178CWM9_9EURO|nr:hypothetical protein AYO20_06515 [Fonsecaea nubica]OAL34259.1 hypothetical protein AYO20_06515 [Fonsecaea nubica]